MGFSLQCTRERFIHADEYPLQLAFPGLSHSLMYYVLCPLLFCRTVFLGVLMKVLAIHRIMPMLLLLLTASWGLIALFDMFEAGITHLS